MNDRILRKNHTLGSIFFLILFFLPFSGKAQLLPQKDQDTQLFGYGNETSFKIPPIYLQAAPFFHKVARVQKANGFTLINTRGKTLGEVYDYIGWSGEQEGFSTQTPFIQGLIGMKKEGKWGLLDEKGKEIIPPIFNELYHFQGNSAIARGRDGFGLIDPLGKWLISPFFNKIRFIGEDNYAIADSTGHWGLFKPDGSQITQFLFDSLGRTFYNQKIIAWKEYRTGLLSQDGSQVLPFHYKRITWNNQRFEAEKFPIHQIIDLEGKEIASFWMDSLSNIAPNFYLFFVDKKSGLMNEQGEIISFDQYDEFIAFQKNAIIVRIGKKFGLINHKGNILLPLTFSQLSFQSTNLLKGVSQGGKTNIFSLNGENLTKDHYRFIGSFTSYGFRVQCQKGKWGFLSKKARSMIPCQFEQASDFRFGYAMVEENGKQGILDSLGNWVIRPIVDSIVCFAPNTFLFQDLNEWGTLDIKGIERYRVSNEIHHKLLPNGFIQTIEKGKVGMLSPDGDELLPTVYDSIQEPTQELMIAYSNGRKIFMSIEGGEIPQPENYTQLKWIGKAGEGWLPFKQQDSFGFMDYLGRARVLNRYDSVTTFREGRAAVMLKEKWGVIDHQDRFIVQPRYDSIGLFFQGHAKVWENGKVGIISSEDQLVVPIAYDDVQQTYFGNWKLFENGKVGILWKDGSEQIYPRYEEIKDIGLPLFLIKKEGKWGADQANGMPLVYPEYDRIFFNHYDQTIMWKDVPSASFEIH